jgi:hypothetical protein
MSKAGQYRREMDDFFAGADGRQLRDLVELDEPNWWIRSSVATV